MVIAVVPLLIHLWNRRQAKIVDFSSLIFLQIAHRQSVTDTDQASNNLNPSNAHFNVHRLSSRPTYTKKSVLTCGLTNQNELCHYP